MNDCDGVDADGDGKADSGTVKAEKLAVIDGMAVSTDIKDQLYRLNGWSEKTLKDAPWHR